MHAPAAISAQALARPIQEAPPVTRAVGPRRSAATAQLVDGPQASVPRGASVARTGPSTVCAAWRLGYRRRCGSCRHCREVCLPARMPRSRGLERETGLRIEEVQCPLVDRDLDRVVLANLGLRIEAPDQRGAERSGRQVQ